MTGAGRYFDETQRLQLTTDGRFINRDAELFEYPLRQILAAPAHHTVDRRDRATFDEPGKGLALAIILRMYRNRSTVNVDEIDLMKW